MINFFAHHSLIEGDYSLKDIKVKQQIGRGNSHVYTAFIHENLYALKQIEIKNDYEYQNFLKQISYMKQISQLSSDMIKYYGYFVTTFEINQYCKRKYAHIVMQCAQMNLQHFIALRIEQRKRFMKDQIIKIIDFLLGAFANLQKNKISHCDIKPENILVLDRNNIHLKLCDVGSCKIIDSQSVQEATVFGTVPFLAPELVKTKSNKIISSNVFKSDVFSFGLVVLYLITFKKFSSKQRIQIPERAYFQVISEWIKEARQLISYDSRIAEVLRGALEFQQIRRPLFKDVKNVYELEKKKKMNAHDAKMKKLEDEQNQKRMKIEENFMSIPTTKINLFRSRNLNTKISTRTTSIGFPKISRNYERNNVSPGQLSPGLSPLLSKRQSSCFGSPEKFNNSTLDFKKIIYVTEDEKQSIPFQFLSQEEKNFVFFTTGINIKKADCISVYQPCSLAIIYELAEVEANKLYLEYEKFQGIGLGSDCPVLKVKKIFANFWGAQLVGGYKNLFRSFCSNQLQALEIVITNADVSYSQVSELLDRLNGKTLKYLGIVWQNYLMNPEQHSMITQKASKLSVKKFTLIMNQNFIKYQKQSRFLLPKCLQSLYLQYTSNFMQKQISNLSISLQKQQIKDLYLNFSNNNLNKSQCNMLFKSVCSLQQLQKLIINLSWNPIQDISYIITSLNYLKNINSFEIRLHHTGVTEQQIFQLVGQVRYLFDRSLKILKVGYDRGMRKEEFVDRLEEVLDGFKGLKIDVIGYDNKYFMAFIKKSSKNSSKSKAATGKLKQQKTNLLNFKATEEQKKQQKSGQCQSLFSNTVSFDNYLCLTCSEFSELSKTEYFCKYCIQSCKHKGHNFVKIYERVRCSCAYSGYCNSEILKRVCAEDLKIFYKKEYDCFKCSRRYCQACIARCLEGHRDWVEQNKEMLVFQCKSQL